MPLTKFGVFFYFKNRLESPFRKKKNADTIFKLVKYLEFFTASTDSFECLSHLAFQVTSAGFFSGQLLVFSRGRKCLAERKK